MLHPIDKKHCKKSIEKDEGVMRNGAWIKALYLVLTHGSVNMTLRNIDRCGGIMGHEDDERRLDGFLSREERKQIVREALKEWLDEQASKFGRWSFRMILSAALAGLVYLSLQGKGWI